MISRAPAVSTKRGRPAKQTSTKDAGKTAVEKPRKRAAPARVTLRALKRQKPAANIKQKLDLKGSMGNTLTIASKVISDKDIEIITISDSEDEAYEPIRKDRTDLSEDKDMGFGAPKMKIHEDDDDVQPNIPNSLANPQPTRNATKRSPFAPFYPTPRWAFSGLDVSESESDLHPKPSRNSQKDMARTEKDHKNETQQLREQLDAAKAELDRVKMLHEKERSDGELIQVRSSNIAREEVQRLQQELEAVRGSMTTAVRERDQLRIDVENSRAGSDQLTKELQEERQSRQSERSENESIVEDLIKSREPTSDTANDFLVVENGRLRTENESLRAAATRPPPIPQPCFPPTSAHNFTPPSSQLFQASIYPSLFASDPSQPSQTFSPTPPSAIIEERKEENVRKHYTKVKRRLEDLQLVTRNLTKSTRGMDLSSFGDFGNHLRQLRTALEVEAKPGVEKQEDEDAK
ncbi:hypothetical protein G6011_11123 [Alternaria panax]|uniref:Uncharacterized protein n=1 Tax=Alternaria panax TaxID=48097 RepID=A0AAD4IDB2_9PLEO|nr:hypothetical protein G6011_11123 [Alternaria panax]